MKAKKLISTVLALTLLIAQFSFISFGNSVYANADEAAETKEHYIYYYDQLTDEAKRFYEAMEEMYTSGMFKTGKEDYDLLANEKVTIEQLQNYANGDSSLICAMGAARDAFYADYPEIFYVDFSYLSIRVTMDAEGEYHAYLGSGRSDNYYVKGFTSQEEVEAAEEEYNARIDEIVAEAKEIIAGEDENLIQKQIEFVHDEIIKNTSYRYETVQSEENPYGCTKGNEGHVRTAYGPLIKHEGLCEGYSRAAKTIFDKLGIPCVLVQGMYKISDDELELHMWDYVQVDGKWYGFDCTLDDPYLGVPLEDTPSDEQQGLDGYETTEYLLVGADKMDTCHFPSGIMSDAEFEFTYPGLEYDEYGFNIVTKSDDLVVKYTKGADANEEEGYGKFKISYKNMGYTAAKEQGIYILANMYQYDAEQGDYISSGWSYLNSEIYSIEDNGKEIIIYIPHIQYVEFAVTDIAPSGTALEQLKYKGTEDDFLVRTEKLYNPGGTYVAPPYIKTITPTSGTKLAVGGTYHIKVVYDERLVLEEGVDAPGYSLSAPEGPTALENAKIENLTWDGESTFEFDFTPSKMWADDSIFYFIRMTGVVGAGSQKEPNRICYCAANATQCVTKMANAGDWKIFGKPTLMETSDLSMSDWTTSDGSPISEELKNRIALITTTTTPSQEAEMEELLGEEFPNDNILKSETYNINLTVCKQNVIKTGHRVQISLGFPEGYGPSDAGVTFKAYHFGKDENGETYVEEIPCIVTQYGLIITCDSFSPFAIAAVEAKEEDATSSKTLILSETRGGAITGLDSIVTLEEGEEVTCTVKADENYQIETITVCGKSINVSNASEMNITIGYDDITDENNIASATFVANSIAEKEAEKNETVVENIAATPDTTSDFELTISSSNETVYAGDEFEVTVGLNNFRNIENGLIAITGKLEYDSSVLEMVEELEGLNGWNFAYNNTNGFKFVADNDEVIETGDNIFKIKFKVKDNAEEGETSIKVTDFAGSGGYGIIYASNNAEQKIQIDVKVEENITSEKYKIESEIISKIPPNATVAQFKQNVETEQEMVFTDKDGNILSDDDIITTHSKLKVGQTLQYDLCVTGDLDGDGIITINDLAIIKLHYIKTKLITDETELKAADIDDIEGIDINDIAQAKLVIIKKLEIK